ncbi:(2Fe-2S)-binding protein [Caenimonas terrae]|uniref:(2Fe-2S)-binding protein n=1 Tax=Caenimonas terrae TaxID=696074 RepID=A0ABW0NBB9_9BURK
MNVRFSVNGRPCEVAQGERCSLVDYLRDELMLRGTRYGCGQERCGACVVLVDGAPRPACQVEAGHLQDRSIATVESLDSSAEGRMLLAQFERLQAGQCGFCLSGILMRSLAFVRESADGSPAAIARALDDHLCRCGAQPRIVAAVQASWQALREGAGAL